MPRHASSSAARCADRHRSGRRDERGASVTALFAAVMVVLLLAVGLVVDGGAQSSARARAEAVAAESARAAATAQAITSVQGGEQGVAGARAAAQRVLDTRGMQGTITIAGGRVTVETWTSTPTTFLSLIGVRQLGARGSASAQLVNS